MASTPSQTATTTPQPPQPVAANTNPTPAPTPFPDIPISAPLLALAVLLAATNLTIFLRNRFASRPRHIFPFSLLLAVFSVTRAVALALRIAWAESPRNAGLALAALVVGNAGVLILVVINLFLGTRLVRGLVPPVGWSRGFGWGLKGVLGTVAGVLVMVVVCTVIGGVVTDGGGVDHAARMEVLLFAGVYMTVLAVLPTVAVVVAGVVAKRGGYEVEGFGRGGMGVKMGLVVFTSVLLTVDTGFKAGVNFASRWGGPPQWYHSRAASYCFSFGIELVVVLVYTLSRFDQRFWVPDGSSAPGHYSGRVAVTATKEAGHKEARQEEQGGWS